MKNLEVKSGEEAKMFFIESGKVINNRNLKIFYISYKNLLRIINENAFSKTPDPALCIIGFTLNTKEACAHEKKKDLGAETTASSRITHPNQPYTKVPSTGSNNFHDTKATLRKRKSNPKTIGEERGGGVSRDNSKGSGSRHKNIRSMIILHIKSLV